MSWSLEEAIGYYRKQGAPGEQNALITLLREIQQENGGSIPRDVIPEIMQAYGVKETFLLAVIRRIPSLRLADRHCLEICAGPNCSKRAALGEFSEKYCRNSPENITVKYVPCMRMCGKGPNIKWDGKIYHQAEESLLRKLMAQK